MVNNTLALLARAPQAPDVANIEQAAQRAHANDQQSQLTNFKIQEAPAEMAYAQKQRDFGVQKMGNEGDQMKMEKDAGYPDIQRKLYDVFNGMDPATYKATMAKTQSMREAYNYIQSFDPKSPEYKQAFDQKLQELHAKGIVDDNTARSAHRTGPTPLAMETIHRQLGMLEQVTRGVPPPMTPLQQSQIDLNEGKAGYYGGGGGRRAGADPAFAQVTKLINDRRTELGMGPTGVLSGPALAEANAKLEAYKQQVYSHYGYGKDGFPPQGAPSAGGKGVTIGGQPQDGAFVPGAATQTTGAPGSTHQPFDDGAAGTEDAPHEPQTPEDLQDIQDGEYYVNPSDGQLYIRDSTQDNLG